MKGMWVQVQLDPGSQRRPGCLSPSLGSVSSGGPILWTAHSAYEWRVSCGILGDHHSPGIESSCPGLDFMPILGPVAEVRGKTMPDLGRNPSFGAWR